MSNTSSPRTALIVVDVQRAFDEWEAAEIFPAHQVFKRLGDLGLLGLTKPQEYGGAGADSLDASTRMASLVAASGRPLAWRNDSSNQPVASDGTRPHARSARRPQPSDAGARVWGKLSSRYFSPVSTTSGRLVSPASARSARTS